MPGGRLGDSARLILLDTHAWIWWLTASDRLSKRHRLLIDRSLAGADEIAVSAFSCWEVALLDRRGRIDLDRPIKPWVAHATAGSGFGVIDVTPDVAVEANQLPGDFHRDPADQIIVATARRLAIPLLTADAKILAYPHVGTIA